MSDNILGYVYWYKTTSKTGNNLAVNFVSGFSETFPSHLKQKKDFAYEAIKEGCTSCLFQDPEAVLNIALETCKTPGFFDVVDRLFAQSYAERLGLEDTPQTKAYAKLRLLFSSVTLSAFPFQFASEEEETRVFDGLAQSLFADGLDLEEYLRISPVLDAAYSTMYDDDVRRCIGGLKL